MISKADRSSKAIDTAEAFYRVFCALPIDTRLAVARYVMEDEEILSLLEIPNKTTVEAFNEKKSDMPLFSTIDELKTDLLS